VTPFSFARRGLLGAPFVWAEHEPPHDFARYSSFALKALFGWAAFVVEGQRKSTADSRVLFQLLNAYVYKITRTENRVLNWLAMLGLTAPINLAGIVVGWVLPANADRYLDNSVLARKTAAPGR
jgi:hypothetical protein